MTSETDVLLAALGKKSSVQILVGTFVSATAAAFIVDVGGGRTVALPGTSYLPEVNESVWVWFVDGTAYVMGPTVAKPGNGTVLSVASNMVTLSTAFGNITIPYSSTLTPSAGQILKIVWQGGGFAIAVMSALPTPPLAPGAPGGGGTSHVDLFSAQDAGSYQSRWWTPQVWASDNNLGAWFYGSKIADTIPAAAVVTKAEVFIAANQIQGSAPNFALHNHVSKPAGAPTLTSVTALAVASGWVTLPGGFGSALKSGGGSAGVGVSHGGYNIFKSLAQDGQSGALRITSTY